MQRTPEGLIVGRFTGWRMTDFRKRPIIPRFTVTSARQLRAYRKSEGVSHWNIARVRSRPTAGRRRYTLAEVKAITGS